MEISVIQSAIKNGRVKITNHAEDEKTEDDLILKQVFESVLNGEIIENYPDDFPFPSCLIFGRSKSGDEIHSVWAYNSRSGWAVLITVYRPDPDLWINWRRRISDEQ